MTTKLLIAGCGDVGIKLGLHVTSTFGSKWQIWGLRRQTQHLPANIQPIQADLLTNDLAKNLPPVRFDCLVYCAAPGAATPEAYQQTYVDAPRNLLQALRQRGQEPRRVVFTSSTAVFGQNAGEWVDETSPTQPHNFRGNTMLEAEALFEASDLSSCIVRLAGIYGPNKEHLLNRVKQALAQKAWPETTPCHYANRIHIDDVARLLLHVLTLPQAQPLYIGVDHDPCDIRVVLQHLATALHGSPWEAPPISKDTPTGKRCRNNRLLKSNFVFQYPTFREGYAALLEKSQSQPN